MVCVCQDARTRKTMAALCLDILQPMSKWILLISAGMLMLATSCGGNPTPQPTQPITAAPVATKVNPTDAPIATEAPSPTVTATPTTATTAVATPAATSTGGQTVSGGDFTPKVRSVWNTAVGQDQMQGACPKGSMLPVYGLVQITPNGATLAWKNQEPVPYTMTKLQPGVYQYAGPTAIKDGVVTMTVKFLSDKALEMNRVFVATADLGCMHTHVYTGTYQWDKP